MTSLTSLDGTSIAEPLLSPARRRAQVVIPAGTTTRYRGEDRITKRAQTITVFSAQDGYLDQDRNGRFRTVLPTISWPGSGGYWVDCEVTEKIFEANSFTRAVNSENLRSWRHHLISASAMARQ